MMSAAMTVPLVMRVMALSISTANRAGAIIRDITQKGNLGIVDKGVEDFQTEADRSAQRCIVASLAKKFPAIKIIGEEGVYGTDSNHVPLDMIVDEFDQDFLQEVCPEEWRALKDEDFVIWVDPLDGTTEFTKGFVDHVTVLIGVAVKDAAVGGIIHQPYYKNDNGALGRTIWGLKGLGTGNFVPKLPPANEFIVTTSRSHMTPVIQAAVDAMKPNSVVKVGGAGYKVLHLLEGKAHAYVFPSAGCKKWDTCAPEAVLEAANGTLTDILGVHYSYGADVEHLNARGVLATFGVSHTSVASKLPKDILEKMQHKL